MKRLSIVGLHFYDALHVYSSADYSCDLHVVNNIALIYDVLSTKFSVNISVLQVLTMRVLQATKKMRL